MESVNRAFSLIELMIVVAIIGILVAVALPQFTAMADEAKMAKSRQDIETIVKALARFNSMESRKAETLYDLRGKYLVKLPTDPWGGDYYLDPVTGVVGSAGPDGRRMSRDDIVINYLPDPILLSVRFVDAGSVRVCLPDDSGQVEFTGPWRKGPNSAPNERRAGPGDIIELVFSKPVQYGACFLPGPFLTHPVTGEQLEVEYDLTCYTSNIEEFTFTDFQVEEDEPGFSAHDLSSFAAFTVADAQYKHIMYIPTGYPDTAVIVLGDVQSYGDTNGDGSNEPYSCIIPGRMYMNIKQSNRFYDRSAEEVVFQPASRSMILRL